MVFVVYSEIFPPGGIAITHPFRAVGRREYLRNREAVPEILNELGIKEIAIHAGSPSSIMCRLRRCVGTRVSTETSEIPRS